MLALAISCNTRRDLLSHGNKSGLPPNFNQGVIKTWSRVLRIIYQFPDCVLSIALLHWQFTLDEKERKDMFGRKKIGKFVDWKMALEKLAAK